jgi:GNAT superfamily N-acetyltransferase
MPATVRPALRAEAPIVADLLRRAGFGSTVGRLLDYPFEGPAAKVFVAEDHGALVGTASVASFGATGWIGALGVEPAARRRGLGGALTEKSIDVAARARRRDCPALLHRAGPPGLRARGFVAEGSATAWRGVRRLAPRHDRAAPDGRRPTEDPDRRPRRDRRGPRGVIEQLRPLRGVAIDDGQGSWASPWRRPGARAPRSSAATRTSAWR